MSVIPLGLCRSINSIFIRRQHKILIYGGTGVRQDEEIATAMLNISRFGYTFAPKVVEKIRTLSVMEFNKFYNSLVIDLELITNKRYMPYVDFNKGEMLPSEEVTSYMSSYYNAFNYMPNRVSIWSQYQNKKYGVETYEWLTCLDLGNYNEFVRMAHMIMANSYISSTDRADIRYILENVKIDLPDFIPCSETAVFIASIIFGKADVSRYVKLPVQILKLSLELCGSDSYLMMGTKFVREFTKVERKTLLGLLEASNITIRDLLMYRTLWKKFADAVHIDNKKHYPKCYEAFSLLRQIPEISYAPTTTTPAPERVITVDPDRKVPSSNDISFQLIRKLEKEENKTIDILREKAPSIETPFLLKIKSRLPQGKSYTGDILKICDSILLERFSKLPPLGKCYISNSLQDYCVPWQGSRSPLTGDVIRLYAWWTQKRMDGTTAEKMDLDLCVKLFDEKWKEVEHISANTYRTAKVKAFHSGEANAAPSGNEEFVNIDLRSCQSKGKYLTVNIDSFTKHSFGAMPRAQAGWAILKKVEDSTFNIDSIKGNYIRMGGRGKYAVPFIVSLEDKKIIWANLYLGGSKTSASTSTTELIGAICRSLVEKPRLNLFDLLWLHVKARGELVQEKSKAKTIFSPYEGITPFDPEIKEFLV